MIVLSKLVIYALLLVCSKMWAFGLWVVFWGGAMRRTRHAFVLAASMVFSVAELTAAEVYDGATLPMEKGLRDLTFPAAPQPFGKALGNRMFKPDGDGPFPAVVLLPVCGGDSKWYQLFDWAKAALGRGYVAMVVDPLTPRGVGPENCQPPLKVSYSRYRKDAFDAAEHLRKQPFVDRDRIGLLGLSLGAMAALTASGGSQAAPDGRQSFGAIVAMYPVCNLPDVYSFILKRVVDLRFIPQKVVVPLQVQLGGLDVEAPPRFCTSLLDEQKRNGAPVDYVVHRNATHNWDTAALGSGTFTKPPVFWNKGGGAVVYRYNAQITAESVKLAFEFFDQNLKSK
jgi:dienelactone hydrolase